MHVKLALPKEVGYTEQTPTGKYARWHVTDTGFDSQGEPWRVSTVFLALDHFGYIYETLVQIGQHSDVSDRYRTRVEAVHGHWFYLGVVALMVKLNTLPVAILNSEGDRIYYQDDEEVLQDYDQFGIMEEFFRNTLWPKSVHRTRTLCCNAPVTHTAPLDENTVDRNTGSLEAPPPRCSRCSSEISSVHFETFSSEEDV